MTVKQQPIKKQGRHIEHVMEILSQQMRVSGFRERTITDYNGYMIQFRSVTRVDFLEDITVDTIYLCLNSMDGLSLSILGIFYNN
jgi:hypothetical protein